MSTYRVSIKWLILDASWRFLLCQEDNGIWELPGGVMEYWESPAACLHREIQEEMGIVVTNISSRPITFLSWLENEKWRTNVIYQIEVDHLNFTPSSECQAIEFFSIEEARKLDLYPNVEKFLTLYHT